MFSCTRPAMSAISDSRALITWSLCFVRSRDSCTCFTASSWPVSVLSPRNTWPYAPWPSSSPLRQLAICGMTGGVEAGVEADTAAVGADVFARPPPAPGGVLFAAADDGVLRELGVAAPEAAEGVFG